MFLKSHLMNKMKKETIMYLYLDDKDVNSSITV